MFVEGNKIFNTGIELKGTLKKVELGDVNIPDSNRGDNLFLVH